MAIPTKRASCTLYIYIYIYIYTGPTLPRHVGISLFAGPRLQSSCCWKPRMPESRCSGFVPPVCTQIDGLDQIGRSHFAISTRIRFLHPSIPIRRYATAKGLSPRLRVNRLVPPPGSNDPWDFASLHDDLSRRFSPSMKRSSLATFVLCNWKQRCYSSRAFLHSDSFRDFSNAFSCARSSITSQK
jgi:hypothetical protein